MKKITKNKIGYTLIEMVIVVAIIVILAGVMILNISAIVSKAKKASSLEESQRASAGGMVSSQEAHLSELGFGGTSDV